MNPKQDWVAMWVRENPGTTYYKLVHTIPIPTWLLTPSPDSRGYQILMFEWLHFRQIQARSGHSPTGVQRTHEDSGMVAEEMAVHA